MIPRLLAAFRYLRLGDKPWKWRVRAGRCPACQGNFFIVFGNSAFHTRCLKCGATAVNLSMIPVISSHFGGRFAGRRAYEMSSYGATHDYLRRHFSEACFSEYFPGKPLGAMVDDVRNEDATQLSFAANQFDVVTSNQVFEHVPDDEGAYAECHRVLKSGGGLIFTVPLYDTPKTEQIARLSVEGTIEWLGEPEYHDSRLAGPQSAPVFWRHSINDIAERVAEAGFDSVRIVSVAALGDRSPAQPVIYATKR
jgi:SAM-dependent methyltransferase